MFYKHWMARVQETFGQPRQQIQTTVGFPQQQPAAVGGNGPPIESGHHVARKMFSKLERGLVTLCHSGSRGPVWRKHVLENMFMPQDPASRHPLCEKSRLNRHTHFNLLTR